MPISEPTMSSLEIIGVTVAYGGIQAIRDVSLSIRAGAVACLLGANGAGKSSLLNSIVGLVPKKAGKIVWDGHDVTRIKSHDAVDHRIALSPEGRRLFPGLTVVENLRIGAYRNRSKAEVKRDLGRVYALFPRLLERSNQAAGTLSGGEQQMCAIGRALMSRPRLLLLDEPSLGLAPKVIHEVARAVLEINKGGTTVLLVEQNAQLALKISETAYVLESGRVALHGNSKDLLNNEYVRSIYLGRDAEAP
jgi:branched-chain amino acid transport system ATP-binding protein